MPRTRLKARIAKGDSLEGQFLLAMPSLTDGTFSRSVVFMCAHSGEGAMGLIINRRAKDITFAALVEQIGLEDERAALASDAAGQSAHGPITPDLPVLLGGPVETNRGFVLHSEDYGTPDHSLQINNGLRLTATVDVIQAMRAGSGPAQTLVAVGYSGWSPGQLEAEIQANGWLHCEADAALIFDAPIEDRYSLALAKLGIDLSHLSVTAGHA